MRFKYILTGILAFIAFNFCVDAQNNNTEEKILNIVFETDAYWYWDSSKLEQKIFYEDLTSNPDKYE